MSKKVNPQKSVLRVFELLEGTWIGQGHGGFPTINHFDYRETLTFIRRDELSLFYTQQSEKCEAGQKDFSRSHWESGFLRLLENDEFELINAQSGGRCEVLTGPYEMVGDIVRLSLVSQSIVNDERMVRSARRWEIEPARIRHEMKMVTTMVEELTFHLTSTLRRAQ